MNKDILSISNSILLSGILIAASIFVTNGGIKNSATLNQGAQASGQSGSNTPTATVTDRQGEQKEGSGKVVVYEFSDFQCPYCQAFWTNTYNQLKKDYIDTGKITFIYRYFPLSSIHQNAEISAEAAQCAADQGKFWQYHDTLFTNGKPDGTGLNKADLEKYASNLGLNTTQFNSCLESSQSKAIVAQDEQDGINAGVNGTPTFFINGHMMVGAQPYSAFKAAIDQQLNN